MDRIIGRRHPSVYSFAFAKFALLLCTENYWAGRYETKLHGFQQSHVKAMPKRQKNRHIVSVISRRSHAVRRGKDSSTVTLLLCGVLQGSVLGPILFVLYTADLLRLVDKYQLRPHLYADDTHWRHRSSRNG